MRIPVVVLGVQAHLIHQILDGPPSLLPVLLESVDRERLGDDRAHGLARISAE
jgi:hypothetical protein